MNIIVLSDKIVRERERSIRVERYLFGLIEFLRFRCKDKVRDHGLIFLRKENKYVIFDDRLVIDIYF